MYDFLVESPPRSDTVSLAAVTELVKSLRISCVSETASVSVLLRQVRFLGVELGLRDLDDWAKRELNGYEEEDLRLLPPYRVLDMAASANFVSVAWTMNEVPIPLHMFPTDTRERLEQILFMHQALKPISYFEDLVRSGETFLTMQIPNLQHVLTNRVYKGYTCIGVAGTISRAAFVAMLESIKNRVQTVTIELGAAFPPSGAEYVPRPTESLSRTINTVIYGGQPNLAIDSGDFTQAMTAPNTPVTQAQ